MVEKLVEAGVVDHSQMEQTEALVAAVQVLRERKDSQSSIQQQGRSVERTPLLEMERMDWHPSGDVRQMAMIEG